MKISAQTLIDRTMERVEAWFRAQSRREVQYAGTAEAARVVTANDDGTADIVRWSDELCAAASDTGGSEEVLLSGSPTAAPRCAAWRFTVGRNLRVGSAEILARHDLVTAQATNELVGTGDGRTAIFWLAHHPVIADSQTITVAGQARTEGVHYNLDDNSGRVSFWPPYVPQSAQEVRATYTYLSTWPSGSMWLALYSGDVNKPTTLLGILDLRSAHYLGFSVQVLLYFDASVYDQAVEGFDLSPGTYYWLALCSNDPSQASPPPDNRWDGQKLFLRTDAGAAGARTLIDTALRHRPQDWAPGEYSVHDGMCPWFRVYERVSILRGVPVVEGTAVPQSGAQVVMQRISGSHSFRQVVNRNVSGSATRASSGIGGAAGANVVSDHNLLQNIQGGIGGAAPERYHMTAAEYAGTWGHVLSAPAFTWTAGSQGSIAFIGAAGALSQDNAHLYWDAAQNQLLLGGGSAAHPAIARKGYADDGLFWPADGAMAFASGGIETWRSTATGFGVFCTPAYPLDILGQARISALTATRVTFAGADGLLSDDANLVWAAGQLYATKASGVTAYFIRSDAVTNSQQTGLVIRHTTSADMVDGFGARLGFTIQDSEGVERVAGYVGTIRAGADATSDLLFQAYLAGGAVSVMRMMNTGQAALVQVGSAAVPALTFSDSLTTGFYRYGADAIGIAIAAGALGELYGYNGGGSLALFDPTDGSVARLQADRFDAGTPALRLVYKDASYAALDIADVTGTGSQLYARMAGILQYNWRDSCFSPYADALATQPTLGQANIGWLALHLKDAAHSPAAEGEARMDSAARALEHYIGGAVHHNGHTLFSGPATAETQTGSLVQAETILNASTAYSIPAALWASTKAFRITVYLYGSVTSSTGNISVNLRLGGLAGLLVLGPLTLVVSGQPNTLGNAMIEGIVLVNARAGGGPVTCSARADRYYLAGAVEDVVAATRYIMFRDAGTEVLDTTAAEAVTVTYTVGGSNPGAWTITLKQLIVESLK